MSRKIIIDTDPGIDDALAIVLAMQTPRLQVLGLTGIFGNVPVDLATSNALRLVELSGQDIPVACGAAKPWVNPLLPHPCFVHGKDGLGEINWPEPRRQAIEKTAAQWMVEQIMGAPGEITLIALGPLTNLALALALEPKIVENVKEVIFMGGSIHAMGNVTPVAEANMVWDPHAADRVLNAGWPIVMVGLDVTQEVLMTPEFFQRTREKNTLFGDFLFQSNRFYLDFYKKWSGMEAIYSHDPSTIAYVLHPEYFQTEKGAVRVCTEGPAVGQTILCREGQKYPVDYWNDSPLLEVCLGVDASLVLKLHEEILTSSR